MTTGLRALPFVVLMTTGSTYAFGQHRTCYLIRPGETAAGLAQRFTGDRDNLYQPWFQILDPGKPTFVPKSHYEVIQAGWQVCVATDRLTVAVAQRHYPLPSDAPLARFAPLAPLASPAPTESSQTVVTRERSPDDFTLLWWAAPFFGVSGLVFVWLVTGKYIDERRASLELMKEFGTRFVAEFERPLFRRSPAESAIRSRLRFAPRRRRMEVLLAPADGRTYPNLVDHRKNVEYDVARVLGLLGDEPFLDGPLHAEGSWVVIPFGFGRDRKQEGVP